MGYIPFMFSLLMLYCVPVAIGYSYYTYYYCHNDCDDMIDDMGYAECNYECFHEVSSTRLFHARASNFPSLFNPVPPLSPPLSPPPPWWLPTPRLPVCLP